MLQRHLAQRHISATPKQMQDLISTPPTFFERLDLALSKTGSTKTALCRGINVANSTVSRWATGVIPRPGIIAEAAHFLKVNRAWLESGRGSMFPDTSLVEGEAPQSLASSLDQSTITTASGHVLTSREASIRMLKMVIDSLENPTPLSLSSAQKLTVAALEHIDSMLSSVSKSNPVTS